MMGQALYSMTLNCLDSEIRPIRWFGVGVGRLSPRLKRSIAKFYDPPVAVPLGKKTLHMPFSHNLAVYRGLYPWYDTALPRLARFLSEGRKPLKMIDVGANVGDTISLITDEVDGEFLAIEADERFLPFLRDNVALLAKVSPGSSITCEKCLIDATGRGETAPVRLTPNAGTSLISESASVSDFVPIWSLDELVLGKHPSFQDVSLIKIDTDGYDFKVLRGSAKLLASARPAVFFEYSPRHLVAVGERPDSIFSYLVGLGYSQGLVYDHLGSAARLMRLDDPELVTQLARHGERHKAYYDILTFHDSQLERFNTWRERERELSSSAGARTFPSSWR